MMMASQRRAERTRQRLLHAAAVDISAFGYDGSSLQRISRAAGVTMGALTFHFPAKLDLAYAIQVEGAARTHEAVSAIAGAQAPGGAGPALPRIVRITLALGELLADEAAVRAAARLTRERTLEQVDWKDSWLPSVRRLLDQARGDGELRPGVAPATVAALTRYLVSGLEDSALPGSGTAPVDELADVWELILCGLKESHPALSQNTSSPLTD
ncbi:TetR/AcrR family transcriptional regulator [Streptomyces sp. NPDC050264]|uniref:TetR/AcrR family transcriptional regulator n=1 Tax=Streptomyces sp. NPDC050264 TaxID=3155038 RepID=UPI003423E27F